MPHDHDVKTSSVSFLDHGTRRATLLAGLSLFALLVVAAPVSFSADSLALSSNAALADDGEGDSGSAGNDHDDGDANDHDDGDANDSDDGDANDNDDGDQEDDNGDNDDDDGDNNDDDGDNEDDTDDEGEVVPPPVTGQ